MPRNNELKKILLIGAGPIIIGQGCEFDYSGTQACKALKEEGYRVVLVNSNPATIMTDPEFADRTYIEPITPECVEKIIVREIEELKRLGVPVNQARSAFVGLRRDKGSRVDPPSSDFGATRGPPSSNFGATRGRESAPHRLVPLP